MPTATLTMRKLKEILRLKYGCGLGHRQIARSLSISPGTVSTYANRAAQLGITAWPLSEHWDDGSLQQAFFKTAITPKRYALPDWSVLHQELKAKTMTLQLLWDDCMDAGGRATQEQLPTSMQNAIPKATTVTIIFVDCIRPGGNAKNRRCDKPTKPVRNCLLITVARRCELLIRIRANTAPRRCLSR